MVLYCSNSFNQETTLAHRRLPSAGYENCHLCGAFSTYCCALSFRSENHTYTCKCFLMAGHINYKFASVLWLLFTCLRTDEQNNQVESNIILLTKIVLFISLSCIWCKASELLNLKPYLYIQKSGYAVDMQFIWSIIKSALVESTFTIL